MKVLIVTALHAEAIPLIDYFRLKPGRRDVPFPIFTGKNIHLVVSGVGKLRAAIATTFLIQQIPRNKITGIINIGICGAARNQTIGQMFLIDRVTESSSGKIFRLQPTPDSPISLSSLITVNQPLLKGPHLPPNIYLVDMEASGFIMAASYFIPRERIACLKIVSDHLELNHLHKSFVQDLIRRNLKDIEKFLRNYLK